jgi:hypothetical protein
MTLQLFELHEIGHDYIVVRDNTMVIRITFADREPIDDLIYTKQDEAGFFEGIKCQVGLEAPVTQVNSTQSINIFLDHFVDLFGTLRSVPFPFHVRSVEIIGSKAQAS